LRLLTKVRWPFSKETANMDKPSPKAPANIFHTDDMLTPKEFAKVHKISVSWLAKARKRRVGPAFEKFGRSVRYFPLKKPV
jgi:hypothetical protein